MDSRDFTVKDLELKIYDLNIFQLSTAGRMYLNFFLLGGINHE